MLHTMGGSLSGTDGWFTNPAAQVSAHFGVSLSGEAHQYVNVQDSAWANGILEPGNTWPGPAGVNPNFVTCSIETEDLGNPLQAVTDAQYAAVLGTCRLILARYPHIGRLARHTTISPQSRAGCPGKRWTESGRFALLAAALGLEPI